MPVEEVEEEEEEEDIILVKSVCRGPFLVAVCGVFILLRDVLLHYVEM